MSILTHKEMRVIVQGITGREASNFVKDSLDYGTKIVGGVTPGKHGMSIHGVRVYHCIRQILQESEVDCSVISVPPAFVKDAALEAIDNGIKLIVIITERVPRKDTVQVLAAARAKDVTVVGPNSMGLISPEEAKIGLVGGRVEDIKKSYKKGPVGIMSRSGGMTTEIANLLTQSGFGQSTCVSIGGDPIVGSNFLELLPLYCEDEQTKALVLYCEPGGNVEEKLSEFLKENPVSLPIVAFVAGRFVDKIEGVRFGHAGTIVEGGKGATKEKIACLRAASVQVVDQLSEIPDILSRVVN